MTGEATQPGGDDKASVDEASAALEVHRKRLAEIDPELAAGLDLDTEDGRMMLLIGALLTSGEDFRLTATDADGHAETLNVNPTGDGDDHALLLDISTEAPDGAMSPELATLAAKLELLESDLNADAAQLLNKEEQ